MLSKTAIALAAASLAVGAAALTPAMANYAPALRTPLQRDVRAKSNRSVAVRARNTRQSPRPVIITASSAISAVDRGASASVGALKGRTAVNVVVQRASLTGRRSSCCVSLAGVRSTQE